MSSKDDGEFDAFLRDRLECFSDLNLIEQPSSQELWQEMIEEIENQKPAESVFMEDYREIDDLHEIIGALLEATGKSEEHAVQTSSHIANP